MLFQSGQLILNKYRIEQFIGAGAFAEVYRATHLQLQAPRALKILRRDTPGIGSTEFGDYGNRFQLEAQLGARLNHPHVIQVYDFESDGDTLILVMEYAGGGSLTKRIERARETKQPLAIDECLRMAIDVAEGLAALHALDAVHRDLKPSNILFDEQGQAKVADLGLAQIPSGPSMRSIMSDAVSHPGTPAYMSPEQIDTRGHLTSASDVYALGCVLFEVLTGRLLKSQRPGTRARALRADVPEWLDDVLARMLAKESETRPWNGAEVATLLKLQSERPASEQKVADVQHKEIERHIVPAPDQLAELEEIRQEKNWRRLAEMGQTLLLVDDIPEPARDAARVAVADSYYYLREDEDYLESLDYTSLLKQVSDAIARTPQQSDYYWLRALIRTLKCINQETNEWVEALTDYTLAIGMSAPCPDYFWHRGQCYHDAANLKNPSGGYDHAIADFTRAIELYPTNADYYYSRGVSYHEKGDYDHAIADDTKAIELDPTNADYYNSRSASYHNKGDYDRAIADDSRAIKLNPTNADYYNSRGVSYHEKSDYNRAIVDLTKAIELDPTNADYYNLRSLSLQAKGNQARADADLAKARELGYKE